MRVYVLASVPVTLTDFSPDVQCSVERNMVWEFWALPFEHFTSAEGGYVFGSVCLSVRRITEKVVTCERILTKFLGGVRYGPGTNAFNFGDDPDHCPDPGVRSPKSAFTGLSKKLPTNFDEILWRAGVWPRDQLFTFW